MHVARLSACLLLAALVAIAAHARPPPLAGQLRPMAQACTNQVSTQAQGQPGTLRLKTYHVTGIELTTFGLSPGAPTSSTERDLPMVEATALDGGTPGSAWKACFDARATSYSAHHASP